jgi:hypothetical protein
MFGAPTGNPNSTVKLESGFGAVPEIQNAWMSRLQPQMDQARQGEMARLKAQGITEDSGAWARSMDTLNRNDVDARNQALLAGANENNNIFNRGLQQNNQVFGQNSAAQQLAMALRGQQFGERQWEENNPYQQMMWLNSMKENPQFAGTGTGTNYSGAGMQDYIAQLGNYNAKTASGNGMISGLAQLFAPKGGGAGGGSTGGGGWDIGGLIGGLGKMFGWGG